MTKKEKEQQRQRLLQVAYSDYVDALCSFEARYQAELDNGLDEIDLFESLELSVDAACTARPSIN